MKFERLAAIAEIVSSVAIVITLGYLAVETRQTNSALQANSREAAMLADVSILTTFVSNPEMNLNLSSTDLSAVDAAQVDNILAALTRVREFAWFQYQAGVMDSPAWRSYVNPLARVLNLPQGALWWSRYRQELDPGFSTEMDRRIRDYSPE